MSGHDAQIEQRFNSIRQWTKGEHRAPHKPLLLLLALGRLQRRQDRLMAFSEIRSEFEQVLRLFAAPRRQVRPNDPFFRLTRDKGSIWEIETTPGLDLNTVKGGPGPKLLCDREARAGFPSDLHEKLLADPGLVCVLATTLLETHFPASIHDDIALTMGLDLGPSTIDQDPRRRRDPRFRMRVLNAYNHRCAVCGFGVRLDGQTQAVEAAHVRWHSHGGPSGVDNGLALCTLHHKLLDLGLLGLDENHRVMVSGRLSGNGVEAILRHAGASIAKPVEGKPTIAKEYIDWHRAEVFKADAA